jgi:hypothetical protein
MYMLGTRTAHRKCSFKVTHFAFVFALFSTVSSAALPQSPDNAAQAKQHYQSAVAAINKNDWQTAKSELLQAERLAPNNALVHYDLALAYSHTGQNKSALSELNKALQLGLPAEQKQAAEQLKLKLQASASTPPNNKPTSVQTFPDVTWTKQYDKFEGHNSVSLILRNISAKDQKYFMELYTGWDAKEQQDTPVNSDVFHVYNFVSFGSSQDGSGSSFAKNGILLLDGNRRLYLTGSSTCQINNCSQRKLPDFFGAWAILELATSSTVEGMADGVEFVLKPQHLAAIKEFCDSRQLIVSRDLLNRWLGKTANEAASEIDRTLRSRYSTKYKYERGAVTNLRIVHLGVGEFSFEYVTDPDLPYLKTRRIDKVELKDLKMGAPTYLTCNEGECVQVSYDGKDHTTYFPTVASYGLGEDLGTGLAYIYYRVMYWGDGLNYDGST